MATGRRGIFLAAFWVLVASCANGHGDASIDLDELNPRILEADRGGFPGISWATGESVLVVVQPDELRPGEQVLPWRLDIEGGPLQALPAPTGVSCERPDLLFPQAIGDGHIALLEDCKPERRVVAFDVETGSLAELADTDDGTTGFAWDPDAAGGIASIGSRVCQGLGWIGKLGSGPLDVSVDGRMAAGDDVSRETENCSDLGRADTPALQVGGQGYAFFASPDSIGRSGQARLRAAWNLYVARLGDAEATRILTGVNSPGDLDWSPDGQKLAFAGEFGDLGRGGWVVDVATGSVRRFTSIPLDDVAFSPDGSMVAAIETGPLQFPPQSRILIFDLRG